MASYLETLMALAQQGQPANGLPPIPAPAEPVAMPMVFQPPVTGGPALLPPDAAPAAPAPPLDMNFVNQYAGPRPMEPAQRPASTLNRIAAALSGFGAGVQGQGAQYLAFLDEQQQRPIRDYQRKLDEFEQRRTRGIEIATRKQQDEQDRTTRAAEIKAEREFQQWAQRAKITDETALQQARQAWELQKIRETERIADEKVAVQQREINDRQARNIEYNLASGPDAAPPKIAKEMAQYIVNGTPLSPAADKWRNAQAQKIRVQIERLSRTGGSGGGGAQSQAMQKAVDQFENIKQLVVDAVRRGDARTEKQLRQKMDAAFKRLANFPGLELGYDPTGKWPYQKPRGQAQQAPQASAPPFAGPVMMTPPPETVQAYMQRWGITDEAQAIREIMGQQ